MNPPRHSLAKAIIRLILLIPMIFGSLAATIHAQQDPRALDPADVFFQAWLEVKRAEKLESEAKYSEAWEKYRQAGKYYDVLSKFHKNWKPHLVQSRLLSTNNAIETIEPKATTELARKKSKTQDLVEGPTEVPPPLKKPASPPNQPQPPATGYQRTPSLPAPPQFARTPSPDPKLAIRIKQLESENNTLKSQLSRTQSAIQSAPSETQSARSTIQSNTTEQKRLIDLIAQKDREINKMRHVLARAPLQQDLDRLSREKQTRERELEITARALKTSQEKLIEAQAAATDAVPKLSSPISALRKYKKTCSSRARSTTASSANYARNSKRLPACWNKPAKNSVKPTHVLPRCNLASHNHRLRLRNSPSSVTLSASNGTPWLTH